MDEVIKDDIALQKRCEKILAEWWGKTGGDPNVYLYRAAYADGQRDGMERAIKAVSDVQPKGAPGLMGELTWTAWEMCERIVAKIRQTAGEAK